MTVRTGLAGLITGVIGGFLSSLYVINESLLHPPFFVLLASLTNLLNFMILMIFVLSFGIFGFGIGHFLDKRKNNT